jgi:hypothetical protein
MTTYTVEVFVKHRHRGDYHVATVRFPARTRDEAVATAERFCGGVAVSAHDTNPASGGGSKRG